MIKSRVVRWVSLCFLLGGILIFLTQSQGVVNAVFLWTEPGVIALATLAPVGAFMAVSVASWLAYRTLRYRARVDDADQWWKRTQYGIDQIHGTAAQRIAGSLIIETLLGSWTGRDEASDQASATKVRTFSPKNGWQNSENEKEMLSRILQSVLQANHPEQLSGEERQHLAVQKRSKNRKTKRMAE
ncbi:hypothetical protein [Glutamicibacter sp. JC586]|uniref:hypothetical protein n=1 Tax=Glutamicibacter sp. JC586 TaxID=2590552 RepID=UPI00135B31DB|nr:hypothetical protein [Glutamicibacter sp. JC586]